MKQVVEILRDFAGGEDRLKQLLDELATSDHAHRSGAFLTLLVRLRKAAGLPPMVVVDTGPKELLELIDRLEAESEKETTDATERDERPTTDRAAATGEAGQAGAPEGAARERPAAGGEGVDQDEGTRGW